MKGKKVNIGAIIAILVLIVLFIPIIVDYFGNLQIDSITSETLQKKIEDKESFLIYVGSPKQDKTISDLRKLRDITLEESSNEYSVYSIDKSNLSDDFNKGKVLLFLDGILKKSFNTFDYSDILKFVNKYYIGIIDESNRSYKVVKDFNSFKKLVKNSDINMFVFGRDTCYYCNLFKPVYDSVAEDYDLDIYFFDSDSYDKNEYTKIVNMDLVVPASCSSKNVDFKLSDGFGTPLTIYTKSGEIIDCISGYVDRDTLLNKLMNVKMISEK